MNSPLSLLGPLLRLLPKVGGRGCWVEPQLVTRSPSAGSPGDCAKCCFVYLLHVSHCKSNEECEVAAMKAPQSGWLEKEYFFLALDAWGSCWGLSRVSHMTAQLRNHATFSCPSVTSCSLFVCRAKRNQLLEQLPAKPVLPHRIWAVITHWFGKV